MRVGAALEVGGPNADDARCRRGDPNRNEQPSDFAFVTMDGVDDECVVVAPIFVDAPREDRLDAFSRFPGSFVELHGRLYDGA